jgi:glycosidase
MKPETRKTVLPRLAAGALAFLLFVACVVAARAQPAAAPTVTKVEPPSWWAGHTINPVRLLVRGTNLRGARARATRPGTSAEVVRVNAAGTYAFIDVRVSTAARPGDYPLALETAAGRGVVPFRVEAPLDAAGNFQGFSTDDVIYLIMTDRFADGDASNDAPADAPPEAGDRGNARAWHGGDFRGVIERLPYLKDLGVTALWLTPWYDNWNGVNRCDKPWCPNTYYHGYHAADYYSVEDRFGDLRALRELVARAHALGIKVIQDQVANHVGSQHPWVTDPPLDDWFHGTPARHLLNPFRGELLLSPHAGEPARRTVLDGWFSDDLPDMNQDEPEVARYEIQNALWWVGATGIDGIRQDTIQYMPRRFIRDLSVALRRQHPRLRMVGEVFDRDPIHTSFFLGGRRGWDGVDTALDSVFDFPVWQTSLDVFSGKSPATALRSRLRDDALYADPSRLVVPAGNHDVRRAASLPGMTVEGAMLHAAFILSVRGTPQLYYGDEIFMEGGEDPDNRRDFPGGFPGDRRSAFDPGQRTERERRVFEWTRACLRMRREHPAMRRGRLVDLASDEETYAFARQSADETIVVAFNRSGEAKRITAPAAYVGAGEGARLVPLIGARSGGVVSAGVIAFEIPARTAAAFKLSAP